MLQKDTAPNDIGPFEIPQRSKAVKRRDFITLLGDAAAAWPLAAHAGQGERMRRVGDAVTYVTRTGKRGTPEAVAVEVL